MKMKSKPYQSQQRWNTLLIIVAVWQLAGFLTQFFGLDNRNAMAEDLIPVKLHAMMLKDEQGLPLGYPADVFFDDSSGETYVVSSSDRITIFSPDYFPQISLGAGRGVKQPRSVYVHSNGDIYICISGDNSIPGKVLVLNAAFFPKKEILFDNIPGIKKFYPSRAVIAKNGNIYVAGIGYEGVLVLDGEGNFLRRLIPIDKLYGRKTQKQLDEEAAKAEATALEDTQAAAVKSETAGEKSEAAKNEILAMMPEDLMPAKRESDEPEIPNEDVGPVIVTSVTADKNGRIYLLSVETSKAYVYNENEQLLFSFGEKGGASAKLSQPRALAVDRDRSVIYVADYMRHTILTYSYFTGKFLFEFGGRGLGPLWFNFPDGIAVDRDGHVIVSDLFNRRVQVIDVNMEARKSLLASLSQEIPKALPPVPIEKKIESPPPAEVKVDNKVADIVPIAPLPPPLVIADFKPAPVLDIPAPERREIAMAPAIVMPVAAMEATVVVTPPEFKVLPVPPAPPAKKVIVAEKPKPVTPKPAPVQVVEIPKKVVEPPAVPAKEAAVRLVPVPMTDKVIRLPAALGVYGPVVTIGLVGGWYLYGEE